MFDDESKGKALIFLVLIPAVLAAVAYLVLVAAEYVRAAGVRALQELRGHERRKRIARLTAMGYKPAEIERLERAMKSQSP